ncbi:hypothetical protein DPMN_056317 [Dreissena polymorpha]|uniref:Uncharacterized protein n=1 Tax=Dreissena polymorpha TaxID=45954 RepID=A0A9D4CT80_DREPO|nr:hypothetical protein DPMN_056317 [Dreissena polymorpha]
MDTAQVSQSPSGHGLLGYLQSTFGLDTARVICTLLSGLIQLEVCYFAEHYDRCSVPALFIDGWT